MSVHNFNQFEALLNKHKAKLKPEELRKAESYLKASQRYKKHIEKARTESDYRKVFIKIRPVRSQAVDMFGSFVKSTAYNEIIVCKSRNSNSEFIPDETKIIFKCRITDTAITDLLFKHNKSSGSPVTISQLFDTQLTDYVSTDSLLTQREEMVAIVNEIDSDTCDNFRSFLQQHTNDVNKLKKSDIDEAIKLASSVANMTRFNETHLSNQYRNLLEIVTKDLKGEAISVFNHHMLNNKEEIFSLPPKNEDICANDPFSFNFHGFNSKELHQIALKLIDLDSDDHAERKRLLEKSLNSYNFTHKRHISEGVLTLSNPCGHSEHFFGDERIHYDYFTLTASFGYWTSNQHGFDNRTIQANETLFQLKLTSAQLMHLLQSTHTDTWTHATMTRFIGSGTKTPTENEEQKIGSVEVRQESVPQRKITEIWEELNNLSSRSTLRSKKDKQELFKLLQELESYLQAIKSDRITLLNDTLDDLEDKTRKEATIFIKKLGKKGQDYLDDKNFKNFIEDLKKI